MALRLAKDTDRGDLGDLGAARPDPEGAGHQGHLLRASHPHPRLMRRLDFSGEFVEREKGGCVLADPNHCQSFHPPPLKGRLEVERWWSDGLGLHQVGHRSSNKAHAPTSPSHTTISGAGGRSLPATTGMFQTPRVGVGPTCAPQVPTGRAPAALILLLVSIAQISEVLRIPANNYDAIPRRGPPAFFLRNKRTTFRRNIIL